MWVYGWLNMKLIHKCTFPGGFWIYTAQNEWYFNNTSDLDEQFIQVEIFTDAQCIICWEQNDVMEMEMWQMRLAHIR